MVVMFFASWATAGTGGIAEPLAFRGFDRPWTCLTYPFAFVSPGSEFFWIVMAWVWLYVVGEALEARIGWRNYVLSFLGYSALAAVCVGVGSILVARRVPLFEPWLPISALTCAWAATDPAGPVLLLGVIPVQRRWIAVLSVVSDVVYIGMASPIVGLMAALPCVLAWYVGNGAFSSGRRGTVVSGRGQKAQSSREFDEFITKVRSREKEREEQDRLRKLFEGGDDGTSGTP